jgi:hypothetical protein
MKIRDLVWLNEFAFCNNGYVAYSIDGSFYSVCPSENDENTFIVYMSFGDEDSEFTPIGMANSLDEAKEIANKEHKFFTKRTIALYKEACEYWEIK